MGLIEIPPKLQEVLGEDATQELIELFNRILRDERQELVNIAEEKFAQIVVGELSLLRKNLEDTQKKVDELLREELETLKTAFSSTGAVLAKKLEDTSNSFNESLLKLFDDQKEAMFGLEERVKGVIFDMQKSVDEEIISLKEKVKTLLEDELVKRVEAIDEKLRKEMDRAITTILESVVREIKSENEDIKQGFSSLREEIDTRIGLLKDEIYRELQVKFNNLGSIVEEKLLGVVEGLKNELSSFPQEMEKKMEKYSNATNFNIDAVRDAILKSISEKFEFYFAEAQRERKGLRSAFVGWMFFFGVIEIGALGFIIYYLANLVK